MSVQTVFKCDSCGATSTVSAAGWRSVLANDAGFHVYHHQPGHYQDACGSECVMKLLSSYLGKEG